MANRFHGALTLSVAFFVLAGCGGSQPRIGAPGAMPRAHVLQRVASSTDLIYATNGCGGTCVVSYPQGELVQTLDIGQNGACADSAGDVYIAGSGTELYEFAHAGSTPTKTFSISSGAINGCSVDAHTGNVAVTGGAANSTVAIFPGTGGSPTTYPVPLNTQYAGFDSDGNLFVDGYDYHFQFALYELPRGGSQFAQITINPNIEMGPGQVQWDGSLVTVLGIGPQPGKVKLLRLNISGSTATVAGVTKFSGVWRALQSWIQGKTILLPYGRHGSEFHNEIGIWKYPKGGKVVQTIKHFGLPRDFQAVTFSPGSKP
jgi:hypothetical protein